MRALVCLLAAGLVCGMLAGCAGMAWAPVVPPVGFVYTQYRAPLDVDCNGTTTLGSKKGMATVQNVLGIVAVGDASIKAAADDMGIVTIRHADYEFFNVLGVYSKFTTIVYGD